MIEPRHPLKCHVEGETSNTGLLPMIEIVTRPRTCIYCSKPVEKKRGEHIVPRVLGGALTLGEVSENNVCPICNSGLSDLDRELCCRSFLGLVASQELESEVYQAWDIDHSCHNLLIEAKPKWYSTGELESLYCYPQVTIVPGALQFRGDGEELQAFGFEDFERVMRRVVRRAFFEFRAGRKGVLHFEKIRTNAIDGYWLPPRIFTRHTIWEIARRVDKQSLTIRFGTDKDKLRALGAMSEMTQERQFRKWGHNLGSRVPTIATFFDLGDTLRALMKLALNLVAAYCPNTPVNHDTFHQAMRLILGEAQPSPKLFTIMGFTKANDIQSISVPNAHSFRIVYARGLWQVLSSYFGGRIGTLVMIPGPNHEKWACADVVAPLRSKKWTFSARPIVESIDVQPQWSNVEAIVPTFQLQNAKSSTKVELGRRKKPIGA